MAEPSRRRGGIVFMAVWLVFWTASILVVLWMVGAQALRGELGAAPFLLIWLAFAGFGLYAGIRRMQVLLGLARRPDGSGAQAPAREWRDAPPRDR